MQNFADIKNSLLRRLAAVHPELSSHAQQQLFDYLLLLDKWNKTYNLTSVRNIQDMIVLHVLDSLAVVAYLQGQRIIDVGTGAGLPGIPLAIARPDLTFYLLDSNGKKIRFLRQVLQQLSLKNVTLIQERAERYHPDFCFNAVISRAFSRIDDFLEKTRHLCCEEGQFLAMKGRYPDTELALVKAPFQLIAAHPLAVAGLNAERHLIVLQKNTN